MARLTGDAARKWLAENPNASYTDNRSGQQIAGQLSGIMKLLAGVSKPFRMGAGVAQELNYTMQDLLRLAKGEDQLDRAKQKYWGLSQEESQSLYNDPVKEGLKSAAGVLSYAVPVGAAKGVTGLKAVGQAGLKGVGAGALGGFGLSESGEELKGALTGGLTGGLFAGALQGIGEGARALTKTAGTGKVVNTLDVDEIAKLPSKTRSGLVKQAKSAGFWDGGLSESKNIQNYLTNRGLAGNTPAETLENLTQEFNRASKLKQEGLKEIGGLSRGYTEQIKNNLEEAIKYKGIGLDSETSKVYNDIIKTLDKGPQGARELDNIVMKWNEAGRLASGAQKTSVAGLYSDAAKAVRDTMRSIPGATKYDQGLKALNQILGVEDTGLISKAAKTAESGGIDLPLFSGAGFRGADIKTPIISNTISKAQAAIGRGQEMGGSGILGGGLSKGIQGLTGMGQRAVPAVAGLTQRGGEELATPPTGGEMGRIQAPQSQGINPLNLMLAQSVLSGQISATEANAVLSLLGMDSKEEEGGGDKQQAINAVNQMEGLYGTGTGNSLSIGKNVGIGGLLQKGGRSVTKQFDQEFVDRMTAYDQQKAIAAGIINKVVRMAGTLNEGEYQTLLANMPNEYSTEEQAQSWFNNIRDLIRSSGSSTNSFSQEDELLNVLGLQ